MKYKIDKGRLCTGVATRTTTVPAITLLETIMALAIITIIFAAVVPQFRIINNSWDSRQANAEVLQNGRVLTDHINRNLSKAVKITAVSDLSETDGYIEFEDNDGNTLRYDIDDNNYIEYGPVGDLSDLAGPVSTLQFACYDACDLDTPLDPVTDANLIRFIKVDTTLPNPASLGRDKTFTAKAYLRTNGNPGSGSSTQTSYDYSNRTQGTNIFAYSGQSNTQVPSSATTPTTELNFTQYNQIEINDGTFYIYSVSSNNNYAQIRFEIRIDELKSSVTQIVAMWNGRGVNANNGRTDGASLYIWNYSSSGYDLLQPSADTEDEVTLTGTLVSSVANYIGGAGQDTIMLFVVSNDRRSGSHSNQLYTDYVELEITTGTVAPVVP